MEEFTICCTEEQTRKALELGAPLNSCYHNDDFQNTIKIGSLHYVEIPTVGQMMGWLRTQGFAFNIAEYNDHFNDHVFWRVANNQDKKWYRSDDTLKDPKDAVLAAIDAALEYLSKNK